MKREIIVGDTHGRDDWKKILDKEKDFTKIRFIGDYWDSFNIKFEQQYNNFLDILAFKKANPTKVDLCIGNHDFHYLYEAEGESYSGFQGSGKASTINRIMQPEVEAGLFQIAYMEDNILFTHAGVSRTWLRETGIIEDKFIASNINILFKEKPEFFRFRGYDQYGDSAESGPLWIRPKSLCSDSVDFTQVVGHTRMENVAVSNDKKFWFIDVLEENSKKYLILDDEELKIGTYEE